ncbi:MAG: glycosyltransferase [Bacteroidetes bacterium]|nr:glycosyltransferase [Bacteroidota bacterium]
MKKKIVQLIPRLSFGGAEVFCIQLSNELAKNPQFEVTLISMYDHGEGMLPLSRIHEDVQFISLGKKSGPDLSIPGKLYKALEKIQPDVIHTHMHTLYYSLYAFKKLNQNIRRIHTLHNLAKKESWWIVRQLYQNYFRRKYIIPVSISEEVLTTAKNIYGNGADALIHNGSIPIMPTPLLATAQEKIASLKPHPDTIVFMNVARITKQKNQRLLLESMAALQAQGKNAIAIILGDCLPADQALYDQLLDMKTSNVHFLGKVNNIGDYLLQADAFVLSSIYEGLPISLLESLSVGLIPVCTAVGGVKDVIDEQTGFLSEEVSLQAFLKVMNQFIELSQSEKTVRKNACRELFQQEYSMEQCAAKYSQLYFKK